MKSSFPETLSSSNDNFDTTKFGPVKLLIVQSTTFCNLDCDYCYLPDRHLKNRLSVELLETIFCNLFSSSLIRENFTIVWHAGEPLSMPIQFYESAFKVINEASNRYNRGQCMFTHSIQTNGTLINQAWCEFVKKHNIRIGVSVDGPAFLHDTHRKTRTGLGTHSGTMQGIDRLKQNGIDFTVICVLTQDSLNYPDEMFDFFVENSIKRVGFNVEETEGVNLSSSLESAEAEQRYRTFMYRMYQLVKQAGNKLEVREFEQIRRGICNGNAVTEGQSTPFTMLSIDHKGNFMTFSPELLSLESDKYGQFILGNMSKGVLDETFDSRKFDEIYSDIADGVDLCERTCEYFSVCGGGAPANKLYENGSFKSTETMYCRLTKKVLVDIVLEDIEHSLGLR